MSFTNPAGSAGEHASSYVRALLELLGDRDPLAVMDDLERALRVACAGVSAELLRRPEAPGKWSMLQLVGHLVHTEIVYGYRVRLVLAEDRPAVPGYDQDLWTSRLRTHDTTAEEALEQIGFLRRMNLKFVRGIPPADRERWGMHSERGEESIAQMIRLLGAHDLVHRRQMQRIRAACQLPPTETV